MHTAKFAGLPEYGWTFTPHCFSSSPKAVRARSLQRFSILSITSLPSKGKDNYPRSRPHHCHDLPLGRATPSTTSDTAQEVRHPVEHHLAREVRGEAHVRLVHVSGLGTHRARDSPERLRVASRNEKAPLAQQTTRQDHGQARTRQTGIRGEVAVLCVRECSVRASVCATLCCALLRAPRIHSFIPVSHTSTHGTGTRCATRNSTHWLHEAVTFLK